MKIKLLKFVIVAAFTAFAAGAFFISDSKGRIAAQTRDAGKKKAEILEKTAGYKTWRQVVKPAAEGTPAEAILVWEPSLYG